MFNLRADSSNIPSRCKRFLFVKAIIKMPKKQSIILLLTLTLGAWPAFSAESPPSTDTKNLQETPEKSGSSFENGSAGDYLSSRFARQNGDVDASILYLAQALEKNPTSMDLATQLLAMQVAKGDMNAALATANTLQKAHVNDAMANLLITVSLVKKPDYAAASKKLSEAFDSANGQLWLPLVDAWLDAGAGKLKKGLTIEEMPVTVGRAASIMNYHLALINNFAGFPKQAASNFNDAVEDAETTPLRVIQQIKLFNGKHPETVELKDIVTKYEAAHGTLPPLESTIETPVDGVAEVLYTMGNVMQIADVRHDAMIYMQLARYLRPDFTLASYSLAEILTDGGAYQRANEIIATIPADSQYVFKASLRKAIILDRMDKTTEALEVLANLAAKQPKLPDPWVAKGDLLRVHKRFLEASIAYSEAITRVAPPTAKDWPMFYARGACFERLDRWSDAKADLQKALDLTPDQPDVLNYLGYGLLSRGESIAEAKTMLEKAIALSPNDPQIIDSMGWALYLTNDYKGALPYLERAVELLPGDATVNEHLGDVYWHLDRKAEARFQWERALTFSPEEADAKKINAKLTGGLPEVKMLSTKSVASEKPAATSTMQ